MEINMRTMCIKKHSSFVEGAMYTYQDNGVDFGCDLGLSVFDSEGKKHYYEREDYLINFEPIRSSGGRI